MSKASTWVNNNIPVIGSFFENDDAEDLQRQLRQMSQTYDNYRDLNAMSRYNSLGAQLAALAPAQQYLSGMLPGIAPFDAQGAQEAFYDGTVKRMQPWRTYEPPPDPLADLIRRGEERKAAAKETLSGLFQPTAQPQRGGLFGTLGGVTVRPRKG